VDQQVPVLELEPDELEELVATVRADRDEDERVARPEHLGDLGIGNGVVDVLVGNPVLVGAVCDVHTSIVVRNSNDKSWAIRPCPGR
jgi:hypothetical protein